VRRERAAWIARLGAILLSAGLVMPAVAVADSGQNQPKPKQTYSPEASKARQQKLAQARARARAQQAARQRELRALETPQFRTDERGQLVPHVRAEAAIIFNPVTGQVLWEENSRNQRSIASITKVMTAMVALEDDPDLSVEVAVAHADVAAASVTYLQAGERVSLEDLLHLTLIASDNGAARTLARAWEGGGTAAFIQRMNEKAIELGLENTTFADSSGLHPGNMSSAYDLSRLIFYASGDPRIAPIMRKPSHQFRTSRRPISVRNTNRLLGTDVDVRGGKTGFIRKAGFCLATLLQLPQGDQVAVVVLGARSNAGRFMETRHLVNWLSEKAQDVLTTTQPLQPEL
jgi:serine-type D-Ala-D-Ala endopeptidase (penicillin-binding protein 7)